ncbi:phosphatidylglycerophosphatase A family protein [Aestuariirhabdus sp. LZHN29]|uniref:phosphatidylglycerophosphatase A family protein n=1 Tax=Aestuariirhabdus sp. LZHN29 TaxID=3417462 RepID=UPI003CEC70C2
MADTPASVWRNPVHFVAFGFGSGAAPVAPGTFGTLAAVPLYLLLQYLPLTQYLLVVVVAFVVGCWLCDITSRDIGVHDHGGIVWDEFVGLWVTMIAAPPGWIWIVVGFALFRLFDILKPWPIRWLDRRVGGGFGIMVDDLLAGVFAWVVMQLLHLWVV